MNQLNLNAFQINMIQQGIISNLRKDAFVIETMSWDEFQNKSQQIIEMSNLIGAKMYRNGSELRDMDEVYRDLKQNQVIKMVTEVAGIKFNVITEYDELSDQIHSFAYEI